MFSHIPCQLRCHHRTRYSSLRNAHRCLIHIFIFYIHSESVVMNCLLYITLISALKYLQTGAVTKYNRSLTIDYQQDLIHNFVINVRTMTPHPGNSTCIINYHSFTFDCWLKWCLDKQRRVQMMYKTMDGWRFSKSRTILLGNSGRRVCFVLWT